jgi:RNA polymerase sigma-70 factor (ECF subfamily)
LTEREFEKTINQYTRLLWKVAAKVLNGVGCAQDAEEVVADVFIDLWQRPEAYDPARGNLKNYLCVKCRSKAIDRFRRLSSHRLEELNEETAAELAGSPEADPDALAAVRRAVDALDEPAREVMVRRFFWGQKPREIAKAMGWNTKKVENVLFRTKGKLREALKEVRE